MSHFASRNWPSPDWGPVATLSQTANQLTTAGSTATEGTDKLTFAVKESGHYRITTHIAIPVASDAATSSTVKAQVAWNNGSAISATDVTTAAATVTAINAKTQYAYLSQNMSIYAVAGTNIVVTAVYAITGAVTVGTARYEFAIAKLS